MEYKMTEQERFWSKVDVKSESDCWNWKKAIDTPGYGAFKINKKKMNSHRVAWILTHGDIPNGLLVCHKCDNRLCCNPSHLFLGTYTDNNRDMITKGIIASGKRNGAWTHRDELLERAKSRSKYAYAKENEKWCSGHQKYEPIEDFGKDKNERDGRTNYCKKFRKEKRERNALVS